MKNEIQIASDMLVCPSISEAVRSTLYAMWDEAFDLFDDERDEEALQIILDLQNVWATNSTYTA